MEPRQRKVKVSRFDLPGIIFKPSNKGILRKFRIFFDASRSLGDIGAEEIGQGAFHVLILPRMDFSVKGQRQMGAGPNECFFEK
jgi:hypothetical protein